MTAQESVRGLTKIVAIGASVTRDCCNARNAMSCVSRTIILHLMASCTFGSGSRGKRPIRNFGGIRAMNMSAIDVRRGLLGVFATSALCAAVAATIAVPTANADPCTAAGLSNTISGVTASAGSYLDAHPDANDALTKAGSQAPADAEASLRSYFGAHPQEFNDLRGIARP